MKYYLVSYAYRRAGRSIWDFANKVMKEDPLGWLASLQESRDHFALISYQEITAEQYVRYKYLIG